jgi:hypothetical protein
LLEGLAFGALDRIAIGPGWRWAGSALTAIGALTRVGLFSAAGVLGRVIVA